MTTAPVTRNCARCGEPFEVTRAHARFCSPRCRVAANRDTRNEPDGATGTASRRPGGTASAAGQGDSLSRDTAKNVVPLRRHVSLMVPRQMAGGDRQGATVRWRCPACHWLQAIAVVQRCEICGAAPGWGAPR